MVSQGQSPATHGSRSRRLLLVVRASHADSTSTNKVVPTWAVASATSSVGVSPAAFSGSIGNSANEGWTGVNPRFVSHPP